MFSTFLFAYVVSRRATAAATRTDTTLFMFGYGRRLISIEERLCIAVDDSLAIRVQMRNKCLPHLNIDYINRLARISKVSIVRPINLMRVGRSCIRSSQTADRRTKGYRRKIQTVLVIIITQLTQ